MQFLHSMIRVKNEEKSIKFYCDLLGLKKGKRIRLEDCYLQYLTDETTKTELKLIAAAPIIGLSLMPVNG